jgi:hypothetical protein
MSDLLFALANILFCQALPIKLVVIILVTDAVVLTFKLIMR